MSTSSTVISMSASNATSKPKKSSTTKKRVISNPHAPKLDSQRSTFRLFDFQAFDNDESADDSSSNGSQPAAKKCSAKFRVQMFGINELGETCLIYVDGYNPFFYIKVSHYWTQREADAFGDVIRNAIYGYYASSLKSVVLVEHNQLYEFTENQKFKFLKLTFDNLMTFNKVRNLWFSYDEITKERKFKPFVYNGVMYGEKLQLYESKIPPLLRYLHVYQISPSGWIEIQDYIPMNISASTCTYEYICTPNQIKPLPQKETPVPYNICSFDIEASSSHGDFPLPKKTYKRLATQIVDSFNSRQDSMNSSSNMSTKQGELALKKMILTAFGYDKDPNIDAVYPKVQISKEILKARIAVLQKSTLETLEEEPGKNDKNKKQFWKITSSFEKLANDAKSLQKHAAATGADDGGDPSAAAATTTANQEGISDLVMEGGFGSAINEMPENAPIFNRDKQSNQIDALQADKGKTLIDILLCTDYTREVKIDAINRVLTDDPILPELKGDEVTFIGTTFMKYGANEPHKNHCLVVGSCDPISNVEVQTVDTETNCLLEWSKLINRENPDIIIGYNIFGFDYQFMFQRALELNCVEQFTGISRIHRDPGYKEHFRTKVKSLAQTKNRLASGDYELYYPAISGRLQIDLLFYFRRDYNMASYKLDDVAGSFIRDDIQHIISAKGHNGDNGPYTHIYSKNIMGLHAQDYIHLEITSFTVDYYQKGKKFQVVDILLNQEHPEETSGKKYNIIIIAGHYPDLDPYTQKLKWGMSKDDVTPQDIFRLSRESSTSRAVVAKYCIQDCNLVQHLMKKTDVLTGYNEMSRICNVPISFLVFRGQGIKLTSYVAKICREKDTLMPDLEHTPNDDGYEGAIVLPPKCAMYGENPVACNDYSSLYPSIAKGWNLSPDSKVWTKLYDLQNNLIRINDIVLNSNNQERLEKEIAKYDNRPNYRYIETRFDHFETVQRMTANGKPGRKEKVKAGVKVCRWALFPNNGEGIIPCIIGDLLKARKETRVKAESESDPFLANVLDKRQLGYKVTANSLYGQMGSSVSTFFEKDVAASITSIGRQMITYARRMVEEIYDNTLYTSRHYKQTVKCRSSYVYGDTDSVFFTFNLEDAETGEPIRGKRALELTIEIAQESAELCSLFLPPPMKLAYEKTLMSFILLSKKRYVGMLYETDPNKGKLKFMGLPLKRRDSCDYVKDVYGGILTILMKEPDNIQKAIEFLNKMLKGLVKGEVSMEKLAITKALRSDYKNPKQIAHRVLADRMGERDPGNKPKPGDRIKYVFVRNQNNNSNNTNSMKSTQSMLLGDRIETPEYIVQNKVPLDYTYYITNQLMNPLQQLLGLALEKIYECKKTRKQDVTASRKIIQELQDSCSDSGGNVDLEQFMKKREKYCSSQVKQLLFDPFLTELYNAEHGIRTIMSFYQKK